MTPTTRIRLLSVLVFVCTLGVAGWMSTLVAASVGRHELAYTDRAEDGDPPEVALGIAMGSFRGIFVNYLWLRATDAKEDGKYFEAIELARAITRLQPRFPRVWVFHAWNLAYNISVTTQTPQERWRWVNAGIRLLRDEGIPANPDDMLLHKELGWIFLHKVGGYTDDSNQYYKRQLAVEWQGILGEPPQPDFENDTPGARTAQMADWLRPIAEAPETLSELRAADPAVAELIDALEARVREPLGEDTLRRHAFWTGLDKSGRLASARTRFGPRSGAFDELMSDARYAGAWDQLIAHLRKRALIDTYNMEPLRMVRVTEQFGPLDWRLPATHGLYWAHRGVQVGYMEVDERNSDAFDFVNANRIVVQSVQELWRFGDLYFDYVAAVEGEFAYYQVINAPDFLGPYGDYLDEAIEAAGIFERERKVYRPYAAGYENLMEDAVTYFFRRGDTELAHQWYSRLRTWEGQNMHAPADRIERLSKPIEEFVQANLFDRGDSPNVIVQEIGSVLVNAMRNLMRGDTDAFYSMFEYAIKAHRFYNDRQFRQVTAAGGFSRAEYVDRDFSLTAGTIYTRMILTLAPEDASEAFGRSPNDLQQFAYDALIARFTEVLADQGGIDAAQDLFPEPEGMDRHRAQMEQLRLEREAEGIEGAQQR